MRTSAGRSTPCAACATTRERPLSEGELNGNVITCPWHGAKWDVTTGKLVEFPLPLDDEKQYQAAVEGEDVFIEV